MKINVSIETDDNNVQVNAGKVLRDYDGRPLEPGEELVGVVLSKDFIDINVTNPDSLKIFVAGKSVRKVVLVAFSKEEAAIAKSQLHFIQNEDNGKYTPVTEETTDIQYDEGDEKTPDPLTNVEAQVEDKVLKEKAFEIFGPYFERLMAASPKHAYAFLLIMNGIKGKEFNEMMRLGHECANEIKKEVEQFYAKGLENIDLENLKANRTKNTDYYIEAANKALESLLSLLK